MTYKHDASISNHAIVRKMDGLFRNKNQSPAARLAGFISLKQRIDKTAGKDPHLANALKRKLLRMAITSFPLLDELNLSDPKIQEKISQMANFITACLNEFGLKQIPSKASLQVLDEAIDSMDSIRLSKNPGPLQLEILSSLTEAYINRAMHWEKENKFGATKQDCLIAQDLAEKIPDLEPRIAHALARINGKAQQSSGQLAASFGFLSSHFRPSTQLGDGDTPFHSPKPSA